MWTVGVHFSAQCKHFREIYLVVPVTKTTQMELRSDKYSTQLNVNIFC